MRIGHAFSILACVAAGGLLLHGQVWPRCCWTGGWSWYNPRAGAGLTVTPYTFTSASPVARFPTVRDEMRYYLFELGVDALFTDNPDEFPSHAGSR